MTDFEEKEIYGKCLRCCEEFIALYDNLMVCDTCYGSYEGTPPFSRSGPLSSKLPVPLQELICQVDSIMPLDWAAFPTSRGGKFIPRRNFIGLKLIDAPELE